MICKWSQNSGKLSGKDLKKENLLLVLNSLAPCICDWSLKCPLYRQVLIIDIWSSSCEVLLGTFHGTLLMINQHGLEAHTSSKPFHQPLLTKCCDAKFLKGANQNLILNHPYLLRLNLILPIGNQNCKKHLIMVDKTFVDIWSHSFMSDGCLDDHDPRVIAIWNCTIQLP